MKVLGEDHPNTATSLNNLGTLCKDLGRFDDAASYLRRSIAIQKKVLGEDHQDTVNTTGNLGIVLMKNGIEAAAAARSAQGGGEEGGVHVEGGA